MTRKNQKEKKNSETFYARHYINLNLNFTLTMVASSMQEPFIKCSFSTMQWAKDIYIHSILF